MGTFVLPVLQKGGMDFGWWAGFAFAKGYEQGQFIVFEPGQESEIDLVRQGLAVKVLLDGLDPRGVSVTGQVQFHGLGQKVIQIKLLEFLAIAFQCSGQAVLSLAQVLDKVFELFGRAQEKRFERAAQEAPVAAYRFATGAFKGKHRMMVIQPYFQEGFELNCCLIQALSRFT